MRLLASILLAYACAPALASDLPALLGSEPNLVVLMRHAQATGGRPLHWDESGRCEGEMRLTAKGRVEAQRVGQLFARHGAQPSIVSSPMCRCLETARAAFPGAAPETGPELREVASADPPRVSAFEDRARELLKGKRGPRPVLFVSHRPNIELLTLELIDEGDLVFGRIRESGEIDVIGKLPAGAY